MEKLKAGILKTWRGSRRRILLLSLLAVTALGWLGSYYIIQPAGYAGFSAPVISLIRATAQSNYSPGVTREADKPAPTLGLRKGEKLAYSFSQNRIIKLTPGSISAVSTAAKPISVDIRVRQSGNLVARVYDENEEGWTVGFEMENALVEIDTNQTPVSKDMAQMAAEMKGEVLAFVLKSGRLQKLLLPDNMSPEGGNQWKDVLARWQIVLSDRADDAHWSRTEEDTTGTYLAGYSRVATARPSELTKRKHRYITIRAGNQTPLAAANTVYGATAISLNPYPTLIEGREQMSVPELGIGSDVVFVFRLKNGSADAGIDEITSASKAASLESAPTRFSWSSDHVAPANSRSGSSRPDGNIKTELARLKQLFADGKAGTPEEVNALGRIADFIKADDSAIDPIFDELASAAPNGDMASALAGVLGAAGTPAAQLALLSIATSGDWPRGHRQLALFSFAQITEPVPQAETWLQWLHGQGDSLANNALLVLAAMGDRLRDIDPLRFNSISQYVGDVAKAGELSLNDKIAVLNALGNLGPSEVPHFVKSNLRSDDAILRQQALTSLQRSQSSEAYNLLMESVRNDPVETVRAAAVKTLSGMSLVSSPDEFIRLASNDNSVQVRREALVGLSRWAEESPKVLEAYQRIAQSDRANEVRSLAAQLLASHTSAR
ncbi:MAG: hypothetical protein FJ145_09035 [Deltaproteobacteria bacterium]|nr:hypothetical protein [Deltaproteobacteria bacterium]